MTFALSIQNMQTENVFSFMGQNAFVDFLSAVQCCCQKSHTESCTGNTSLIMWYGIRKSIIQKVHHERPISGLMCFKRSYTIAANFYTFYDFFTKKSKYSIYSVRVCQWKDITVISQRLCTLNYRTLMCVCIDLVAESVFNQMFQLKMFRCQIKQSK